MKSAENKINDKVNIRVIIPNSLRNYTGGKSELECNASNLKDLVTQINDNYPEFQSRICDNNGEIKNYFNIYIDGEDSRHLNGMDSQIIGKSEVVIVAAVAGG